MAKFTLTAAHTAILAAIATTVAAGNTYFISAADGKDLKDNGFIEVNPEVKDDNGNIAARLTDKGREAAPAAETKSSAPLFVMATDLAPIKGNKAGAGGDGSGSIYPYTTMPLGAAFFVPFADLSDEDLKKKSKSFGSTVSQVNKANPERYLTVRAYADGKEAGFIGQNEDGTPNPEAYAGVKGIAVYHRPLSEKRAAPAKKAEGQPAA